MEHTGLIGHPVSHSLSPVIHGYWLRMHGIEGDYTLHDIAPEALTTTLEHWRKKTPLRGVNVTVPHKQSVIPFMDRMDAAAQAIGAVNTIRIDNGEWHGTNTDAYGFMAHFNAEMPDYAKRLNHAVVLGAGGAARAAIHALKCESVERITILNRTYDTARTLAAEFDVEAAPMESAADILLTADMLTNTTSAGMKGNAPLLLPMASLPLHAVVYDIVYAPLVTPLLAEAHAYNLATVDGLGMLLYQAQKAFEYWWGVLPAVTPELRAAVVQTLEARA